MGGVRGWQGGGGEDGGGGGAGGDRYIFLTPRYINVYYAKVTETGAWIQRARRHQCIVSLKKIVLKTCIVQQVEEIEKRNTPYSTPQNNNTTIYASHNKHLERA